MPNTLVHLALQTAASRALLHRADFKWIAAGCVIPDVPWIAQRLFLKFAPNLDPYALLDYATVQTSLFGCLILSGALALIAAASARTFLLLALNSLCHLALDSLEIKWANGVHFFAPLSWKLTGFGLIWPEHPLSYALSLAGLAVLLSFGLREWRRPVVLTADPKKYGGAALLLALYFTVPLLFMAGPAGADNHFAATLQDTAARPGKSLELDRSRYRHRDSTVRIFTGERLRVVGLTPSRDGLVSVRGRFVDENTIHVSALHVHNGVRDAATITALSGILLLWGLSLSIGRLHQERSGQPQPSRIA